MIQEHRLVLSLDDVILTGGDRQTRDSGPLTEKIIGGELLLIRLQHHAEGVALGDLCSGLIAPSGGRVRFLGRDWARVAPDTANAMRGRIGRVHSRGAWIDQLTLRENILMPQLHHTRLPVEAVQQEALRWAAEVGLPGLPVGYPPETLPVDLERAAWIRAFMGNPMLVLLEEPTEACGERGIGRLVTTLGKVRVQGTAVIWMTLKEGLLRDSTLPATRRYRLVGQKLVEVKGA